jgi:hypothetical protein
MNMASAFGLYAKIDADTTPDASPAVFALTPATTVESPVTATSKVTSSGDGDVLQVGDKVRIFRPFQNNQPSVNDAIFEVTAVQRQVGLKGIGAAPAAPTTSPSVTIKNSVGASLVGVEFKRGDMIAKVNANDTTITPLPNTVQYAVVTNAAAPATATTDPNCPANQRCLARRLNAEANGSAPVWQILAQNITNFQLQYLLDDNSIVDVPTDRSLIKAVLVTITGETVTTRLLSNNVPKTRQLTSYVKLRNRR